MTFVAEHLLGKCAFNDDVAHGVINCEHVACTMSMWLYLLHNDSHNSSCHVTVPLSDVTEYLLSFVSRPQTLPVLADVKKHLWFSLGRFTSSMNCCIEGCCNEQFRFAIIANERYYYTRTLFSCQLRLAVIPRDTTNSLNLNNMLPFHDSSRRYQEIYATCWAVTYLVWNIALSW